MTHNASSGGPEIRKGRTEQMDGLVKRLHGSPSISAEYAQLAIEHATLVAAVKKMHAAKGRYHSQQAACDLYELVGLPYVRP